MKAPVVRGLLPPRNSEPKPKAVRITLHIAQSMIDQLTPVAEARGMTVKELIEWATLQNVIPRMLAQHKRETQVADEPILEEINSLPPAIPIVRAE